MRKPIFQTKNEELRRQTPRTIQLELTQKEHISSFLSDAALMGWIEKKKKMDFYLY